MAHLPGHSEAAVSEYRTDTGELRPLYADVMAALDGMGDEGMRQRWRQAKREVALDAFSHLRSTQRSSARSRQTGFHAS